MKRAAVLFLIALLAVQLTGCGSTQLTERTDIYSGIRLARLSDQASATVGMESQRFEGLLSQLAGAFKGDGVCEPDHTHAYLISLLTNDEVTMAFYLDAQGAICADGKRFVSAKNSPAPVQIEEWHGAFTEAQQYTTPEEMEAEPLQGDPKVLVKSPPKRLAGTEFAEEKAFCATAGGWDYYIGTMPLDGTLSIVLWREGADGLIERLCSMPQPEEALRRHEMKYVEGSLEKSNGKFMFFTIKSGASGHRMIWRFEVEKEKLGRFMDYPCSNIVLTDLSVAGLENRAWVAVGQTIMAIDMSTGFLDYEASLNLRNAILDSVFYEPESKTLIKNVELADLGNGVLGYDVITMERETGQEVAREGYNLNIVTYRITRR